MGEGEGAMNESDANKTEASAQPAARTTELLREEIEQTRAGMSATLGALETRLNPGELRGKVEVELQHLEARVRDVVHEHLSEAKTLVKEELVEAKHLLRTEMGEAEEKIKKGLADARDTVKEDLQEAVAGAKRSLRAATLGRVENLATDLGDTMNDTRDTLIETVRQNPLPAALAGLGLAWLLMNRSSSARRSRVTYGDSYAPGRPYGGGGGSSGRSFDGVVRDAAGKVSHLAHDASEAAAGAVHQASGAVSGAAHDATDFVGHLAHQTADAGGALLDGAVHASSDLAHRAGDAATFMGDQARTGARRVEQGLQSTLHESPLALGAAALAVGAAVGFALPRTQGEDQIMGQARDRIVRRAGEAAHDAAVSVAHLTEKTAESAKQALDSNGGVSGSR
jgi:hypothetical protein